jgi:penicillin-binding protein 1A
MEKKKRRRFSFIIKFIWIGMILFVLSIVSLFTLTALGVFGPLPSFEEIENPKSMLATEVYSADGVLIGKYYFENRSIANFDEIPQKLKNTLIAREDIRFYDHSGIDFWGTVGGILSTFRGDKRGASTITQQLAKNLFPRQGHKNFLGTLKAKLKEWVTAVKLERRYTKDEIINLYLNTVDFGNNSFGIKSASRTYFNKAPDSLKIEECAVLVGMLKGPSMYNPRHNPRRAMERRNNVIDHLEKYNFITKHVSDSIKAKPIKLNYVSPDHNEGVATYFREQLRMDLTKWCKENTKPDGTHYNIYTDGLKIYTTINYKMQQYAEEAVAAHMKELQAEFYASYKNKAPWGSTNEFIDNAMHQSERYQDLKDDGMSDDSIKLVFNTTIPMTVFSYKGDIDTVMSPYDSIKYYKMFLHSGFMVMDPNTGAVVAWVGGINHHYFQFDHVNINAKRQVGSTIKPILYTVAIENGYSPCYEVPNTKVYFENYNNWSPDNSDNKYGGILTLYQGLAGSVNCISAYLMKQLGPKPMIDMARRMGVESPMDPGPAICLGTPDISVFEMVGAYGTFADKGVYTRPYYIAKITDKSGATIQDFQTKKVEVVNEQVAYVMTKMLENVVNNGTAKRLRFKYKITAEMGGKTGTTQNNTDGWFMAITPQLCAGTWVGGEDRVIRFHSMQFGQGASMALPIWAYFIQKVYDDKSLGISPDAKFAPPQGAMTIETDCGKYNNGTGGENQLIFGEDQ